MNGLTQTLTHLASPWAYVVIGVLAALEASALVGLVVPGELALLVGGYIAHQGNARLDVMMAVGALGAIAGDSIGYELGRHLGGRLRTSRVGRRIGEERWNRAEAYLEAKGGRAIFFGRFVGILRALVPAVAGTARMPYRRFLAWNAAGAVIWASGTVLVGYLAGSSYQRVERYAGRAGLLLLVLAVTIAGVVATARWIGHHQTQLRDIATTQLERPRVARLRARYQDQLQFLARRLSPGAALGLSLTVQLVLLTLSGWAFGSIAQDVIGRDDLALFDRPITTYVVDHRTAWLTTLMRAITSLGNAGVLLAVVVLVGSFLRLRRRSWGPLAFLGGALIGAVVLDSTIKVLVGRPRPTIGPLIAHASGFSFPSGHATQATSVWGALALVLIPDITAVRDKVIVGAGSAIAVLLVGVSRVYLGVHWTTDVLGGWALGTLWLTALTVVRRGAATSGRDPRPEVRGTV